MELSNKVFSFFWAYNILSRNDFSGKLLQALPSDQGLEKFISNTCTTSPSLCTGTSLLRCLDLLSQLNCKLVHSNSTNVSLNWKDSINFLGLIESSSPSLFKDSTVKSSHTDYVVPSETTFTVETLSEVDTALASLEVEISLVGVEVVELKVAVNLDSGLSGFR